MVIQDAEIRRKNYTKKAAQGYVDAMDEWHLNRAKNYTDEKTKRATALSAIGAVAGIVGVIFSLTCMYREQSFVHLLTRR